MPRWLRPARRRGVEVLDDPSTPDGIRAPAMRDVTRSNTLFGGARAVRSALTLVPDGGPGAPLIVDVGTGTGDIPARIVGSTVVGVDLSEALLRQARERVAMVVAGNALQLPLRDASADVVICSQLLHHFEEGQARAVLRELHRVARRAVVVSDLTRSWFAAAGFWLASTALRFHPVTRHDGVVSVLRGFTGNELRDLIRDAVGVDARVDAHLFWRVTAVWTKERIRTDPVYT